MNYFTKKALASYIGTETMDEDVSEDAEKCNCGEDHGSGDKNVAPSVIDGAEKAKDTPVSYDDKPENENGLKISQDAADGYLAMCKDETPRKMYPYVGKSASGEMKDFVGDNQGALNATSGTGRKHADGTPCKAQSPESCPFNKKVEQGEKEITGKEHKDEAISSMSDKELQDAVYDIASESFWETHDPDRVTGDSDMIRDTIWENIDDYLEGITDDSEIALVEEWRKRFRN